MFNNLKEFISRKLYDYDIELSERRIKYNKFIVDLNDDSDYCGIKIYHPNNKRFVYYTILYWYKNIKPALYIIYAYEKLNNDEMAELLPKPINGCMQFDFWPSAFIPLGDCIFRVDKPELLRISGLLIHQKEFMINLVYNVLLSDSNHKFKLSILGYKDIEIMNNWNFLWLDYLHFFESDEDNNIHEDYRKPLPNYLETI